MDAEEKSEFNEHYNGFGCSSSVIKSALFIHLASKGKQIHLKIIHTGQHYDFEIPKIFVEELTYQTK